MRLVLDEAKLAALPPSQRAAAEAQLAKLREAFQQNPLWRFHPHERQRIFLGSTDPTKLFIGGNRSGKTTCGIVDDLIQAVDARALPPWLLPYKHWPGRFHCRIIVPDFQQTLEGVVLEKIREWCPKDQYAGGSFKEAYDKLRHTLSFSNGNWFQFMTFEQHLDKFQGAALDRVHYDEEPPDRIRRENLMRLIDRNGQEMLTMTPLSGMTWVYETHVEPWEKANAELPEEQESLELVDVNDEGLVYRRRLTVVTVDMDDNPHLNEEAKHRVLDDPNMSEEERKARKSGRFISFAGLVYGQSFKKHLNVTVDPGPPIYGPDGELLSGGVPEGAEVYVGIDPGLRHMAAVVFMWLRRLDARRAEAVVFDELAIKDQTIGEVAQAIHLKNAEWRIRPRWYVIDPAAQNRSDQTGRSGQMEYADHGIFTILGQNNVPAGIDRVKAHFENAWREAPPALTVSPAHVVATSLYVSARCVTLLDQVKRYRWAAKSRSEDDPRERPVKTDDHLLDALRYIIMSRPQPPELPAALDMRHPLQQMLDDDIAAASAAREGANHTFGPGVFL